MHLCHTSYIFIVWHIKRMTWWNTFLFIPRNDIQEKFILRDFSFSYFSIKNEPFLGSFAPPATGRTSAVFSMVLDLFFPKHCVHKDTARYVLSNSKPFGLLSKILILIWKICFEITHLLNMSHKLGHLSRNFAAEINKIWLQTILKSIVRFSNKRLKVWQY